MEYSVFVNKIIKKQHPWRHNLGGMASKIDWLVNMKSGFMKKWVAGVNCKKYVWSIDKKFKVVMNIMHFDRQDHKIKLVTNAWSLTWPEVNTIWQWNSSIFVVKITIIIENYGVQPCVPNVKTHGLYHWYGIGRHYQGFT